MISEVNIAATRASRNYSTGEIILRVLWMFASLVYRLSPRPCFGFRRWILRCFGAQIGAQVNLYPSSRIYYPWNLTIDEWSTVGEHALIYNLGHVRIGRKVTISHGVHLCAGTHDYSCLDFPMVKPPIIIQDQAWICADAFVGPGVTIGEGAVVGARAVVTKSVGAWDIVAGNPIQRIGQRKLRVFLASN
jgi:putative colanic acid biosynthesis acetyltransferase WcaF